MEGSGHVDAKTETSIFTHQILQENSGHANSFKEFLRKSGNLILEMFSEELHKRKTRIARKANNNALLIDQVELGKTEIFLRCEIQHISSFNGIFPLFIITHRRKHVQDEPADRFRGFISGWNGFSVSAPLFTLGVYEEPTCATAFHSSGQLIAAGCLDGSLCIWDMRENSPAQIFAPLISNEELINTGCIRLPSFVSCGRMGNNHLRAVKDIAVVDKNAVDSSDSKFQISVTVFFAISVFNPFW